MSRGLNPPKPGVIQRRLKSWNFWYNFKWNQPYLNHGLNLNRRSNSLNSVTGSLKWMASKAGFHNSRAFTHAGFSTSKHLFNFRKVWPTFVKNWFEIYYEIYFMLIIKNYKIIGLYVQHYYSSDIYLNRDTWQMKQEYL